MIAVKYPKILLFLASLLFAESPQPDFDIGRFYNIHYSIPSNWHYSLDDVSDIPSRQYTSPDSGISFWVVSGAGEERIRIEEIRNDYLDQIENDSSWKIKEVKTNGVDVVSFQSPDCILIGACFQQSFFQGTLFLKDSRKRREFSEVYNNLVSNISPFIVAKDGPFVTFHSSVSFENIRLLVEEKFKHIVLESNNEITGKQIEKLISCGAEKIIIRNMPDITRNDIEKLNSEKVHVTRE